MRDLIIRILNEHTYYNDFTVQYVGRLSEEAYKKYILGIKKGFINEISKGLIEKTQNEIQDYANKIGPVEGIFIDNHTKEKRSAEITIDIGKHFAERVFRTKDYPNDERFVSVDKKEGVDVVVANVDKIVKSIVTSDLKKNDIILLKSERNGVTYQILVSVLDKESGKPPKYTISLFNQIKGKSGVSFKQPTETQIKVINPYF
jgi:hypothetical protein